MLYYQPIITGILKNSATEGIQTVICSKIFTKFKTAEEYIPRFITQLEREETFFDKTTIKSYIIEIEPMEVESSESK